ERQLLTPISIQVSHVHSCILRQPSFPEEGVEHSLKASDDLGGTYQEALVYVLPDDVVFDVWTSVLKESVKIKIFRTYAEARQAGEEGPVASAVRIESENFWTYSKHRHLSLFCSECLVCKSVQQSLHSVRLGNEVFPGLVDLVDRGLH